MHGGIFVVHQIKPAFIARLPADGIGYIEEVGAL